MKKEEVTVHGFLFGVLLCNFSKDVPINWPTGHVFVNAAINPGQMTCEGCKENKRKREIAEQGI